MGRYSRTKVNNGQELLHAHYLLRKKNERDETKLGDKTKLGFQETRVLGNNFQIEKPTLSALDLTASLFLTSLSKLHKSYFLSDLELKGTQFHAK